jgi:hypothetical protein
MHTLLLPVRRMSLALALGLSIASLAAVAGPASDVTEVEITVAGKTEHVVLDNLKVGESRQLYSAAGTLVTAVRTAEAIELDIAGEKTSIAIHDGQMSAEELETLMAEGDGGTARRIVHVHRDTDMDSTQNVDGKRSIVIVTGDAAEMHALHDGSEDIDVVVDAPEAGDGKRVVVKRRIVSDADGKDAGAK